MMKKSRTHGQEEEVAEQPPRTVGLCPFVECPFDECFVTSINSQNIDLAIYYCGKHFEECEIYKKRGTKGAH